MFYIAFFIYFCYMTARIWKAFQQEAAIFQEFHQHRKLVLAVLLFPLGPIIYWGTSHLLGALIGLIVISACYLPALILARKALHAFDSAGTDRVDGARKIAEQICTTAIVGLVYVGISLVFYFLASGVTSSSF